MLHIIFLNKENAYVIRFGFLFDKKVLITMFKTFLKIHKILKGVLSVMS